MNAPGATVAAITLAVLLAALTLGPGGVALAAPEAGDGEPGWPGLSILWSWIDRPGIENWIGGGSSDDSQPVSDPDGADEPPDGGPTPPPDDDPPADEEGTTQP